MIVGITAEKVQRYIYQRIDDTYSRNLNDTKTLSNVIRASNEIKYSLLEIIKRIFEITEEQFILNASGKIIFRTDLTEKELEEREEQFFKEVYIDYSGKIFPIYTHFYEDDLKKKNGSKELFIIEKVNKLWKEPSTKNNILQKNKDILFQFPSKKLIETYSKEKNYSIKKARFSYDEIFIEDMDNLVNEKENYRGKIAIVKADVNNLGKIFQEIKDYEEYKNISFILSQKISIEYFGNKIKESYENLKKSILPFYIVGDDIFYAVKIESLFLSLRLMKSIIDEINKQIKIIVQKSEQIKILLSIGVTFVDNHQPIRYYRQVVEKELGKAKKEMKSKKEDKAKIGVSISGVTFFNYIEEFGKGEADGLSRFQNEIEELKLLKKEGVFTSTFIHNLLEILERENCGRKQMRLFLYYAMANIQGTNKELRKKECYFKLYLFSKLYEKREKNNILNDFYIESKLIPMLKLILLLTDEKYVRKIEKVDKHYIIKKEQDRKIKSRLFLKPLDYIYKLYNNEKESKENKIFNLFIQEGEKRGRVVYGYKKAKFHSSFFYRIKNLIEIGKENKIMDLFENYTHNFLKSSETDTDVSSISEEGEKIIYTLSFTDEELKCLKENLNEFTKDEKLDFFDDLILFYKYSEERIKYSEYLSNKDQ